jgi:hypothetical protein
MGSSWSRRDRIIRLAKLRGDRAALAIMDEQGRRRRAMVDVAVLVANGATPSEAVDWTESELRALWGDR